MAVENGEGHGVASDRLPAGWLVERGGSDNPGFVRVMRPNSVATAGLVHTCLYSSCEATLRYTEPTREKRGNYGPC
jgi:hypothetical protein